MPGGRPKGAKNKRTVELLRRAAESEYADPVDFMLSVMADKTVDMDLRVRAAGLAAPYLRSKLTASEKPTTEVSDPIGEVIGASLPDFTRAN